MNDDLVTLQEKNDASFKKITYVLRFLGKISSLAEFMMQLYDHTNSCISIICCIPG